jgi:signal transduction histidine kinase
VATATVQVRRQDGQLVVRVDDDGIARPDRQHLPGVGLLGMRERVSALGGRLHAGPRPQGGFEVHALLPVRERP